MGMLDELGARQTNAANFIMDFSQYPLSFVPEAVVDDPHIVRQVDEKPMLLLQYRRKGLALKGTAGAGTCTHMVKQDCPQVGGAVTFRGLQHRSRAFPS